MEAHISLPDIPNTEQTHNSSNWLSSIKSELDLLSLSWRGRIEADDIDEILPSYYESIGSGFEGIVYEHTHYDNIAIKVFYEERPPDLVNLYHSLPQSEHLPVTYHATPRYKVMEKVESRSISEMQDDIIAQEWNTTVSYSYDLQDILKMFDKENVLTMTGTGMKFNHARYGEQMKELISFIVSLSEQGIFINDLSISNVHYDSSIKKFIILDYDLLSTTELEFPRFLEEHFMSVYKERFLTLLLNSSMDKGKCIDVFDRVTIGEDTVDRNWLYLFTGQQPEQKNNRNKESFFEQYYLRSK